MMAYLFIYLSSDAATAAFNLSTIVGPCRALHSYPPRREGEEEREGGRERERECMCVRVRACACVCVCGCVSVGVGVCLSMSVLTSAFACIYRVHQSLHLKDTRVAESNTDRQGEGRPESSWIKQWLLGVRWIFELSPQALLLYYFLSEMMLADVLWNNACLPSYHLFHRHRWHLETLCNLISFSRKYSCCVELLAVRSAYISIFTSQPHCLHLWVKLGWNLIETEMCQGICFLTTSSLLRHTYHSCYKNEPLYTIWQRQFTFYLHVYIMYTWKKGVIILTLYHITKYYICIRRLSVNDDMNDTSHKGSIFSLWFADQIETIAGPLFC
jgi:hypothetical protein